ncbi:hypothetical protein IQ06DRAFT_83670 [Phaeosphaeriaceae sp. SRC1lsM3a]|nr:hypothetical protein IQ06DRAFT_83670 [Stagonospora sp. SRC1lsM3a]
MPPSSSVIHCALPRHPRARPGVWVREWAAWAHVHVSLLVHGLSHVGYGVAGARLFWCLLFRSSRWCRTGMRRQGRKRSQSSRLLYSVLSTLPSTPPQDNTPHQRASLPPSIRLRRPLASQSLPPRVPAPAALAASAAAHCSCPVRRLPARPQSTRASSSQALCQSQCLRRLSDRRHWISASPHSGRSSARNPPFRSRSRPPFHQCTTNRRASPLLCPRPRYPLPKPHIVRGQPDS